MAVISYKRRKTLEKTLVFALHNEGKYPINAKAIDNQILTMGKLSKTKYDKVVKKANKMLDKDSSVSAKKSASKKPAICN